MSKILLRISQGFLFLSLLTPFIMARQLYFPFVSGKIIFFKIVIELALLFYLLAFLIEPKQLEFNFKKFFKNPIFISVCIFTLLFFASSFWGINPKFSLFSNYERGDGAFQMLHYFIFFFLLVALFRTKRDWKDLFIASIFVSLIVSFYAVGQFVQARCLAAAGANQIAINACGSNFLSASTRVSGTLGNPSYLAVYILFTLFFISYLFLEEKQIWSRVVLGVIAIFEFWIFFQSQTRGVFLGLIVSIFLWCIVAVTFYLIKKRDKRNFLLMISIIGALAIFLFILSLVSLSHPDSIASRFIKVFNVSNLLSSLKDRFWTWGSAVAAIIERPFGWGAENFSQAFDKYYNPKLFGVESWFDRAHNIYLDYALIGGVPLLIAFLAIFFFFYCQLFRNFLNFKSYFEQGKKQGSLLFILVTAYLIQGLVLFDIISTYIVLFMVLAFAINCFSQDEASDQKMLSSKKASSLAVLAMKSVVGLLIVSIFFGIYWLGLLPYQRSKLLINAILKSRQGSFENIISNFEPVLYHRSPVGNNESFLALAQYSLDYLSALYKNEVPVNKDSLDSFMKYLNHEFSQKEKSNDLIGTRPILYLGWINFYAGRITNDNQYFQQSAEYFKKGLKLSPTRMEFIYANLELALAAKDRQTAKSMLELASLFRPDLEQTNRYYEGVYKATFNSETN